MRTVTLTELRRNLDAFLNEAQSGDIVITRYGKEVGRLIGTGGASGAVAAGGANNNDANDSDGDSATANAA